MEHMQYVYLFTRIYDCSLMRCVITKQVYTYVPFNRESLIHPYLSLLPFSPFLHFSFRLFVSLRSTRAEEIHGCSLKNKRKRISVDRMRYISLHLLLSTANQICLFSQSCCSLGFVRFVIWSIKCTVALESIIIICTVQNTENFISTVIIC